MGKASSGAHRTDPYPKQVLRAAFKGARRWADNVRAVAEARSREAWEVCQELDPRLTTRPVS